MSSKFNINMIKEKLNSVKKGYSGGNSENSDLWKPEKPTTIIRLVPYKYNLEYPFSELQFHYGIGKSMLSPRSVGKADPIYNLAYKLYKSGNTKDMNIAKNLFPKLRVYVPVIVRGEEDKGVRFWGFGKQIYEQLLELMANDEFGDITDVSKGTDLTIKWSSPEEEGTAWGKVTITPRRNASPLSDDPILVEKWLENQKDIFEIFKMPTLEEMNARLTDWLSTSSGTEEETEVTEKPEVKIQSAGTTLKEESSGLNDFDKMFDEK